MVPTLSLELNIAPPVEVTLTETAGPLTIKATHAVWAIPRCRIAQKRTCCRAFIPPIPLYPSRRLPRPCGVLLRLPPLTYTEA
jgi:hypothetical protein